MKQNRIVILSLVMVFSGVISGLLSAADQVDNRETKKAEQATALLQKQVGELTTLVDYWRTRAVVCDVQNSEKQVLSTAAAKAATPVKVVPPTSTPSASPASPTSLTSPTEKKP